MHFLTQSPMIANLCLPLQQVAVWFSSHNKKEMPTARLIHRLRFLMQKSYDRCWLGRESVRGYLSLSTNPTNVYRPKFSSFKRLTLSFKKEVNHNVTA